jgi:putative acetyltransferase
MIIRREQPGDAGTLRDLFAGVYSEDIFQRIQADEAKIPEMAFVALGDDQRVIGHVGASRGTVDDAPAVALVPPSVDPDHRGHGVGQALMHTVLGAAEAAGESLVGVVATPREWFAQFGFGSGEDHSITPHVGGWIPYFQIRPLTAFDDTLHGTFVFPAAFG